MRLAYHGETPGGWQITGLHHANQYCNEPSDHRYKSGHLGRPSAVYKPQIFFRLWRQYIHHLSGFNTGGAVGFCFPNFPTVSAGMSYIASREAKQPLPMMGEEKSNDGAYCRAMWITCKRPKTVVRTPFENKRTRRNGAIKRVFGSRVCIVSKSTPFQPPHTLVALCLFLLFRLAEDESGFEGTNQSVNFAYLQQLMFIGAIRDGSDSGNLITSCPAFARACPPD